MSFEKYQVWIEARKRHRLSDVQIQMARELGLNPKKLGKIDNHKQEPWKMPLPDFIADLYFRRFRREQPEIIQSIEEIIKQHKKKKLEKHAAKASTFFWPKNEAEDLKHEL